MKQLLIPLFCLLPLVSFAQSETSFLSQQEDKRFFGGLTMGLNVSQVDGDGFAGFHSAGLSAGGVVYWFFARNIAGSMSFLYSQKGSYGVRESYSPYAGAYYAKYKMRLNYVAVPVVLHYLFGEKYMLGAGASFNALLSARESMLDMGAYVPFNPDDYPFDSYTFDVIGSISMVVWKRFIAEATYQYGVTPLRAGQVPHFVPGMGDRDQYNNMLSFRLIYLF